MSDTDSYPYNTIHLRKDRGTFDRLQAAKPDGVSWDWFLGALLDTSEYGEDD